MQTMPVIKTPQGFSTYHPSSVIKYDTHGKYRGRLEINMFSEDPPSYWIEAATNSSGEPCYNGKPVPCLTQVDMEKALKQEDILAGCPW